MNEQTKTKKHLNTPKSLLVCALMVILHCIAVIGVYLLAEGGFSIGTIGFSYNVPELLCFLPLIIPITGDLILRFKTDINPFLSLSSAFISVIIFFSVYVFYPHSAEAMFYGEHYVFVLLSLISFAVRCVYSIVDFIVLKKYKMIIAGIIIALAASAQYGAALSLKMT